MQSFDTIVYWFQDLTVTITKVLEKVFYFLTELTMNEWLDSLGGGSITGAIVKVIKTGLEAWKFRDLISGEIVNIGSITFMQLMVNFLPLALLISFFAWIINLFGR